MKNKSKIIVALLSLFLFQKCKYFHSGKEEEVISQALTYDSISRHSKDFDVFLETTIAFKNDDVNDVNKNGLSLHIGKVKFLLHPIRDSKKIDKETGAVLIKFSTEKTFHSKTYKNDTLTNQILNSKIATSDGNFIDKDSSYQLLSLILGYPANNKALKYE